MATNRDRNDPSDPPFQGAIVDLVCVAYNPHGNRSPLFKSQGDQTGVGDIFRYEPVFTASRTSGSSIHPAVTSVLNGCGREGESLIDFYENTMFVGISNTAHHTQSNPIQGKSNSRFITVNMFGKFPIVNNTNKVWKVGDEIMWCAPYPGTLLPGRTPFLLDVCERTTPKQIREMSRQKKFDVENDLKQRAIREIIKVFQAFYAHGLHEGSGGAIKESDTLKSLNVGDSSAHTNTEDLFTDNGDKMGHFIRSNALQTIIDAIKMLNSDEKRVIGTVVKNARPKESGEILLNGNH